MKRYRPLAFFGLAIGLALVTSVLVFSWMQNEKNRLMAAPIPATKNVQVLVANADLAWGTKLTPEMMQLEEFPPGVLPEGHFTESGVHQGSSALGGHQEKRTDLESKLAPLGTTSGGVAAVTDPNKRAMSVKVDDVIGVAGFIKPADRVDVMVTIEPEANKQGHPICEDDPGKRKSVSRRHADGTKRQGRRADTGAGHHGRGGRRRSREAGLGFDAGTIETRAQEPTQRREEC